MGRLSKIISVFILCFLLIGAFSTLCFADDSDETVYNRVVSLSTSSAVKCFLPVYLSDVPDTGSDGISSYPLIFTLTVNSTRIHYDFHVSSSHLYILKSNTSQVFSYLVPTRSFINCFYMFRDTSKSAIANLSFLLNNSYVNVLDGSYSTHEPYSFSNVFVYSVFSNSSSLLSSFDSFSSYDVSVLSTYLSSYYSSHKYLHDIISIDDFVSSYIDSGLFEGSFSSGLLNFSKYVSSLVSSWGSVIIQIVDKANWILILPVFAYIFVVASSSLRSFYKG